MVERPRPDLEYLGSELPIELESDTTVLGGKGSFPSGHVARASAIAFVLVMHFQNDFRVVGLFYGFFLAAWH